jgi:plastocyanin
LRKLALLLTAAVCLVGAAAAVAKTVTVTITKAGYVPSSVTVAQGDTVQFTNSDTIAHQVTFKSVAGVTCTPNPLVLQPAASGSCTFQQAGSYTYSDPNSKGNTFRGSVTVTAAPESISLTAKPLIVVYGHTITLSGVHSTQKTGDNVDVLAQQCGASGATKVATVQTTTGGAFASAARPLANTAYTARMKSTSSPAVTVRVRPSLHLARVAAHRYRVRVLASQSFVGKYASFQRFNSTLNRWVAVRIVKLGSSSAGVAPTVVTRASFRSTIGSKLRVRVTLAQRQVGSCYAAGLSNTVTS